VPALDEQRRAKQDSRQPRSGKLADLGARLEALRALQEKVQTEGKLKPWLAKHGLDGLQGLWTQVHIEAGWETALESALRERLNALSVGRARHGARLRRRRAAGQAGLLHAAAGRPSPTRTRRCRACPTCCA
jgi:chromosome segregation ATPase